MAHLVQTNTVVSLLLLLTGLCQVAPNPDAKRLYDDLLGNYNRLIRPVANNTDKITVRMGLKLSQLVDLVRIVCFCFVSEMLRALRQDCSFKTWRKYQALVREEGSSIG